MKWTVESAKAAVTRNGGRITSVYVVHEKPGIRLLGAIDFLIGETKLVWTRTLDY